MKFNKKTLWKISLFILLFGILGIFGSQIQTKELGGVALSGKVMEGSYYILSIDGENLRQVTAFQWTSNLILWVIGIGGTFIGFIFFVIAIMVNWLPILLGNKSNNKLPPL